MEIQVEQELLHLINLVGDDFSKVINEALNLWLKGKIPICPLTNRFCVDLQGSCNNCSIAEKALL